MENAALYQNPRGKTHSFVLLIVCHLYLFFRVCLKAYEEKKMATPVDQFHSKKKKIKRA